MAAKIRLGTRPKSFASSVTIPMHEGGEGVVPVQFRYRTKTEFGAFVDGLIQAAGTAPPKSQSDEDVRFSLQAALEATRDQNADYLLQVLDGWGLDAPFDRASVVQLCDELPGAALALIDRYRLACTEGRLGN